MAAGDSAASAARFVAAAQTSPTPNQARLAAVSGALALLASHDPEGLSRASQLLQDYQIFGKTDTTLPFAERSVSLVLNISVLVTHSSWHNGSLNQCAHFPRLPMRQSLRLY